MATPTISLATMGSSRKKASKSVDNKTGDKTSGESRNLMNNEKKLRKFWGEESNEDSIYSIYLKKITYSGVYNDIYRLNLNNSDNNSSDCVTRSDQTDSSTSSGNNNNNNKKQPKRTTTWFDDQQCLQWETRQTRTIRAATLDHIVKYVLLVTPNNSNTDISSGGSSSQTPPKPPIMEVLEEERNNVAHIMHVLFCTYRQYHPPQQLLAVILKYMSLCCQKQLNFLLNYWLDNYSEDFKTEFIATNDGKDSDNTNQIINNTYDSIDSSINGGGSCCSSANSSSVSSSNTTIINNNTNNNKSPILLVDKLLSIPNIDERIYKKCLNILDMKPDPTPDVFQSNQKSHNKSSSVLELDPRFIAQQITAIDLENFLYLKPYSLLTNSRQKSKIETMIKNFNQLSKHVIITILKAHSPHIVASHWIEVAHQLRKIKNFNSLKAIIAGLTNESIYRLKLIVWSKLSRASISTFKWLSTIVDDVNNQTLLRHTQLIIEGTSKASLEDESCGTIPYLGTFLTDITMINTRYPNYIESQSDVKLINFEKCSQQYEILMQIQLLQKNVMASLTALQQQTQQLGRGFMPTIKNKPFTPTIPRVARIFRIWFQSNGIDVITDKQCYEMSLALESSPTKIK
ncbi:ras guanine nucleotide exchange factor A-like [Oppia nitens]|uniref:ras guanine nucleotide exchange factor A-like n=1 Tax=Oppia nitens TaxID=1686743 RepID=UPI0023DBECF4|nr:ras guanine nucleotide exchange factor A-like [Oppia nitens]